MKLTQQCPKCSSRRLWVIDQVAQSYDVRRTDDESGMHVHVAGLHTPTGGYYELKAGHLEAWVCANCGFAEWCAANANDVLAKMATQPQTGVRLLDTTAHRGPFR
jgi:predicted nucleic-acid-binding Zn-ribbon protein